MSRIGTHAFAASLRKRHLAIVGAPLRAPEPTNDRPGLARLLEIRTA
jgi:hypothetical protein